MKALKLIGIVALFLSQSLPTLADDVITNIMSPIASYQYPDNVSTAALTNGGFMSPLFSYEYPEDLGNMVLSNGGIISPIVSYLFYDWPGTVVISNQPNNCLVEAGSSAAFSVVVGGEPPFSYQWWFGNTPIVGGTNASFTITNVQYVNAGYYSVTIGNLYGSTNSTVALLNVYVGIIGQGWTIKTYRNGSPVNGLADADALISGGFLIASTNMAEGDMVGFSTGEGTGHFSINNPVPGIPNTQATDNYAVQGTGFVVVSSTGQYTFGLNTDDGARLRIDGSNVIVDDVRSPPHDSAYVTVCLSAGLHPIEWTWFNEAGGVNGGGGEGEIFGALGVHTGFDAGFQLVGNTPGLLVASAYSVPINTLQTSRAPTPAEIAPLSAASPTSSQLMAYHGGMFTANLISIDPNQMTIVLTHGWNSDPNAWAAGMAYLIRNNLPSPGPNIVAWDWSLVAKSALYNPGIPAAQTGNEGRALGAALLQALGANYSKPIHFIGHSLGTLVNSSAANYLHGDRWAQEDVSPSPWPGANTQLSLFDEAEAATGQTGFLQAIDTLIGMNGDALLPKPFYYRPLPKEFAWADNYVSAFGLLHAEAANVILTNGFPVDAKNVTELFNELTAFHGYPVDWYNETIQHDGASLMGFRWSFEQGGWFSQAPSAGSVYVQAFNTSQWDLTAATWNYGTNLLAARFQEYRNSLAYAVTGEAPDSVAVNGTGSGQNVVGAFPAFDSFIFSLLTTPVNSSSAPQIGPHPIPNIPGGGSSTTVPAYAWMQLDVPSNAVSMSFDYRIQGDWANDSLAAAFDGTNVLLIAGNEIQTNTIFSSGSIDVSVFAGQTNEFFIGIVGGTSTNAQLTVENLAFSISFAPSLQVQLNGGNLIFSWPMSAQNFSPQTTTDLGDPNSWVSLTNIPAIVDFQNVITNPISGSRGFYRLMQSPQ